MIRITIDLRDAEAEALRLMCQRFRLDDAQHFLRDTNGKPDSLCEAITRLRDALDSPNKT